MQGSISGSSECGPEALGYVCFGSQEEYTVEIKTPQGCHVVLVVTVDVCEHENLDPIYNLNLNEINSGPGGFGSDCIDWILSHDGGPNGALDELETISVNQAVNQLANDEISEGWLPCNSTSTAASVMFFQTTCTIRCFKAFGFANEGEFNIIWEERPCSGEGCCMTQYFFCDQNGTIVPIGGGPLTTQISQSANCGAKSDEFCLNSRVDPGCRLKSTACN